MLQIQHQPQPQVQAPQAGPVQNPLYYLAQHQSPPAPSTAVFAPSSMFDTAAAAAALPSKQAPVGRQQHSPWHQAPETTSSSSSPSSSSSSPTCGGCSSSAASCYASTLSPVASAAFLLEARLHISQQTHPHSGLQQQQQQQQPPHSATMRTFPSIPKPAMWRLDSVPSTDPDMQELGLAAQQQQLSSCVMVK